MTDDQITVRQLGPNRYACTVPLLDAARKQASLLTPASQEVTA